MKPLLGGKGANLAEMTRIGLPVPTGFTLTTEVCTYFYEHKRTYPPELKGQVAAALAKVERSVGQKFGDKERPLLVSVRSGARDSMPGMMDTILNLGMNDEVVEIVSKKTVGRDHRADPPIPELAEDALELGERVLHLAATNGLRPDQRLEAQTRVVVEDKLSIAAAEQLQLAVVAMGRADDENGSRQAHSISAAPKLWSDGLQNSPLRRAA